MRSETKKERNIFIQKIKFPVLQLTERRTYYHQFIFRSDSSFL